MNPLQYLPVVGTIYRAVTGDVIPETVRRIGSLVVSGLLGGPIGLATSVVSTIAEKLTGIDPEKIVAAQFHAAPKADAVPAQMPVATARMETPAAGARAEIPGATVLTEVPASAARVETPAAALTLAAPAPSVGWTAEQLAAYGVRSTASGMLKLDNVEGADVLNTMEMARLSKAAAAYAANQTSPAPVASRSG